MTKNGGKCDNFVFLQLLIPHANCAKERRRRKATNQSRWQRRKWDFFPLDPRPELESWSQGSIVSEGLDIVWSGLSRKWERSLIRRPLRAEDKWRNELGRNGGGGDWDVLCKMLFRGKKGKKSFAVWWSAAFLFFLPSPFTYNVAMAVARQSWLDLDSDEESFFESRIALQIGLILHTEPLLACITTRVCNLHVKFWEFCVYKVVATHSRKPKDCSMSPKFSKLAKGGRELRNNT